MKDDLIYFGSMEASNENRKVYIVTKNEKTLVKIEGIVEIYPIKSSFWLKISGDFSLGFNYSKGSDVGNLYFSGNLDYRKRKHF